MSLSDLTDRLSARDRRALRLGALVLLPALGWILLASPYLDALGERRAELRTGRDRLGAELRLLAERDRISERVEADLGRLRQSMPRLFGPGGPGLATAALTQHVQDRAAAGRVLIRRVTPLEPARAAENLVALPLEVEAESDLRGMLELLSALEYGRKSLRLENLRIDAGGGARSGPGSEEMEVLSFRFAVAGFALAAADTTGAETARDVAPEAAGTARDVAPEAGGRGATRAPGAWAPTAGAREDASPGDRSP